MADFTRAQNTPPYSGLFWSDGQAASAANDYFVTMGIRTPYLETGAVRTFNGNSLTILSGGNLALKGFFGGYNEFTANNLILDGGSISQSDGANNRQKRLFGNITVLSQSTVRNVPNNFQSFVDIESSISGSADLVIEIGHDDTTFFGGNNSNYEGDMHLNFFAQPADPAAPRGSFVLQNGNALGTGDIYVGDAIELIVEYDAMHTESSLFVAEGGVLDLDGNDLTFDKVSLGDEFLTPGTYAIADLIADYDEFVVNGATGSLTVLSSNAAVPEPGSLLLTSVIATALVLYRRRRKK